MSVAETDKPMRGAWIPRAARPGTERLKMKPRKSLLLSYEKEAKRLLFSRCFTSRARVVGGT
jgi:hypothetical protein